MQAPRLLSLISIVLVSFAVIGGCVPDNPDDPTKQPASTGEDTGVTVDSAIKGIAENWSDAEDWVPRVKDKYKEGTTQFTKARDLYDNAKKANNAWLEMLITYIKDKKKPEKSPEFKDQAKVAAKASQDFVAYARSLEKKPGVAAASVAVIADLLISSGFKIYAEYGKHQQVKREQKADDLRKRLKFPTWENAAKRES